MVIGVGMSIFVPNKRIIMGNFINKSLAKNSKSQNVVDLSKISGTFSVEEKVKLLSGNGFVKVPTEELKRLRIDAYSYLM